ncbi:MAG: stage V sporulation protein SpoVM [Ruminococcaceae bacterium]|nr:stage V sporulation protein SpoVM [Oscillospiraceae bacterium]
MPSAAQLCCEIRGGVLMKVVVVKSPKLLGGVLRLMFGIKKDK